MCWRVCRRRSILATACVATFLVAGIGCARPAGTLFAQPQSPWVWPPPPEPPRITLVGALAGSADLHAAQSATEAWRAVFRGPRPPLRFSSPTAVAYRSEQVLAVADAGTATVHVIDLQRRTHTQIAGWSTERFALPAGVAWVGGRLLVTDAQRSEVIELSAGGAFQRRFGGDVLNRPVGIAYVPQRQRLYVVDGGNHRIVLFDLDGRQVGAIGRRGGAPGEFNFPSHLGVRGDRVVVADTGNFRVQLLDLDGRCLTTIGRKGDGAGDFALPKGVAFDRQGHIYVVDAQFENVQIFDDHGRLLLAFGEEGGRWGQFWLPAGLTIDDQDRIWVADAGNRRLQVFAYMGTPS